MQHRILPDGPKESDDTDERDDTDDDRVDRYHILPSSEPDDGPSSASGGAQESGQQPTPTSNKRTLAQKRWADKNRPFLTFLAMISCCFLIGDGCITPPNTVLGALNSPVLQLSTMWNVVMAVVILLGTFAYQKFGSKFIGFVAGPLILVWFLAIGGAGLRKIIVAEPKVRTAIVRGVNPATVVEFWSRGKYAGFPAFKALSGITLCVTGTEALYADMGHFGAPAITLAWFFLVFPCLLLQYMGQSILLYERIEKDANAFKCDFPMYDLVTEISPKLQWPMTILAALAAVIASQAMISGLFSILSQAHALEFLPRILVLHTNPDEKGQVVILLLGGGAGSGETLSCWCRWKRTIHFFHRSVLKSYPLFLLIFAKSVSGKSSVAR